MTGEASIESVGKRLFDISGIAHVLINSACGFSAMGDGPDDRLRSAHNIPAGKYARLAGYQIDFPDADPGCPGFDDRQWSHCLSPIRLAVRAASTARFQPPMIATKKNRFIQSVNRFFMKCDGSLRSWPADRIPDGICRATCHKASRLSLRLGQAA